MEEDLFQKIYRQYYPVVFRICLGYVKGDKDIAKDICQEIFIHIWENYDNFREGSQVGTWIYRITVNGCLNEIRRIKNYENRIHNYETPTSDSAEKQQDEQQVLTQCIGNLQESDRIIALLLLEGLSNEDIAQTVGTTNANIRVKAHRIKEKLREIYLTQVSNH